MAGMPPNTWFQVFFLTGPSVGTPWRAQSHHKSQRWPSCRGCASQNWTNLRSVGHILYWVLVLRASFSCFQVFFLAVTSTTMPWRAQFHHKYQRWQRWHTCMPQNCTFIECWSYALLSVGLARLFLSLSRGYVTILGIPLITISIRLLVLARQQGRSVLARLAQLKTHCQES